MEELEKQKCQLPTIFAEMFKDEINSNDEQRLYNGVKRIVKKFSEDNKAILAIEEFTRVITGGASLNEIMQIASDEAENPSLTSDITVNDTCNLIDDEDYNGYKH